MICWSYGNSALSWHHYLFTSVGSILWEGGGILLRMLMRKVSVLSIWLSLLSIWLIVCRPPSLWSPYSWTPPAVSSTTTLPAWARGRTRWCTLLSKPWNNKNDLLTLSSSSKMKRKLKRYEFFCDAGCCRDVAVDILLMLLLLWCWCVVNVMLLLLWYCFCCDVAVAVMILWCCCSCDVAFTVILLLLLCCCSSHQNLVSIYLLKLVKH